VPGVTDCWPEKLVPDFQDVSVGISRTRPATPGCPQVRGIEALFIAQIAAARVSIYAESQYFASRKIAEAIGRRLEEENGPEIVLVNPVTAQGWLEPLAMDSARARLMTALQKLDRYGRLRVYHPFNEHGEPIYVHAKILIIDGRVLRIGSANFNNRSLGLDTECDITIDADSESEVDAVRAIRDDLLAEHLGVPLETVSAELADRKSLIDTIESLRGSARSLRPYAIPDLTSVATWLADNEVLDPESPGEMFEPTAHRGFFGDGEGANRHARLLGGTTKLRRCRGDDMARRTTKIGTGKGDAGKIKGEAPAKAPKLPAGTDSPTHYAEAQGSGGETHQTTSDPALTMTTQQGTAIADAQNSLKIGTRGPTLLEDFQLREKIFHFDHERIPERVVHARGYGAHGFFELTDSLSDFTRADVLSTVGQKTEVFVRFSTVAGRAGSSDLARDVRGFSVKMYTREGNWDIVGNNIPVFFIQDAIKFPDLIHAAKEEPDRGFPQAQTAHDNFWDFATLMPESWHMIMWIMSDRSIPRSFRTIEGFGVHSFRLVDAEGKSTFVKFHWKPKQGLQSVLWNEAVKINGADPDFHRRDLWEAIESGDFPEWELGVQLFDQETADKLPFDHLDATKLIPEEDIPVRIIGRLVLDRTVDNFFAHTEQVAFCTANVPPGVDFSDDPLLHGRNFSYLDTQLKRLGGPNFTHLPVNAPRCPVMHFQQDGHMAMTNPVGRANYEPNSWGPAGGPRENPAKGFTSFAAPVEGEKHRIRSETFADHYSQARMFLKSQQPIEQKHVGDAIVFELSKVTRVDIRARALSHLLNIDTELATTVADGLGMPLPEPAIAAKPTLDLPPSPKLSIIGNGPKTFKGRKMGLLLTDGSSAALFNALIKALEGGGAVWEVIAPKIGGVTLDDGTAIAAKQKIDGGPSVLYDAVAVLPSAEGAALLATDAAAKDFVSDAFGHCKFIGYSADAKVLFDEARIPPELDAGFLLLDKVKDARAFVAQCAELRFWLRETT
jgi:catalase